MTPEQKRLDELEKRQREFEMEIRSALLQIVASIERAQGVGKYAARAAERSVTNATQAGVRRYVEG